MRGANINTVVTIRHSFCFRRSVSSLEPAKHTVIVGEWCIKVAQTDLNVRGLHKRAIVGPILNLWHAVSVFSPPNHAHAYTAWYWSAYHTNRVGYHVLIQLDHCQRFITLTLKINAQFARVTNSNK